MWLESLDLCHFDHAFFFKAHTHTRVGKSTICVEKVIVLSLNNVLYWNSSPNNEVSVILMLLFQTCITFFSKWNKKKFDNTACFYDVICAYFKMTQKQFTWIVYCISKFLIYDNDNFIWGTNQNLFIAYVHFHWAVNCRDWIWHWIS